MSEANESASHKEQREKGLVEGRARDENEQRTPFFTANDRVWMECECSNPECEERVGLTKEQYEALREDSRHFCVTCGHEDHSVERVVDQVPPRYTVVEKRGEAADVVDEMDPRE